MGTKDDKQQEAFRAGLVRVVMGLFSLLVLPVLVPGLASIWPVSLVYVVGAVVFQYMILKGIGGVWRVLAGGLLDVVLLTFLVHQLGSSSSVLTAAYPLIGMLNAMVTRPWTARTLGFLCVAAYAGISFGEATGVLPYAPADPGAAAFAPDLSHAARSTLLLTLVVLLATFSAERITRALQRREQELVAVNASLEELSQRDPLTRLYNRRHFVNRVDEELARVRRGHQMALLMIDLDRFKKVNDVRGHLAGDELLKRIAQAIMESTREVDVAGRYGGDEFVVLLTDTAPDEAEAVAERLVNTVRNLGQEFDGENAVTASIGVAVARPQDDIVVLLNTADEAAYRAKQAGGDRFHAAPPASNSAQFDSGPRTGSLRTTG